MSWFKERMSGIVGGRGARWPLEDRPAPDSDRTTPGIPFKASHNDEPNFEQHVKIPVNLTYLSCRSDAVVLVDIRSYSNLVHG